MSLNTVDAGNLRKMTASLAATGEVSYSLALDDRQIPLAEFLGREIEISYTGVINCVHCSRKSNKSFNQGYCYPCFKRLARCDQCIVKPEKCHYHLGTCREPDWADEFCMQDHYVYLANTSGVKVGITRGSQIPTRWIDQGATQALPIYRVHSRYVAGLVEVLFKDHLADKTNWRAMLKGDPETQDLAVIAADLQSQLEPQIQALLDEHGLQAVQRCDNASAVSLQYPVQAYPAKIVSANLDKDPELRGKLTGIKGQYLMLVDTVINLRKFGGYHIEFKGEA